MKLDKQNVLKDLGMCARCRQCRMVCEVPIATTMLPICPTGEYFKWDTYFATGRVTLAKKILLNKIELDDTILKAVYTCTMCGSCLQQCPILNFNPLEATMILRQMAVEKGLADKAYHLPPDNPLAVNFAEDIDSDTALFIGTDAQSDQQTVDKIAGLLKKTGLEFKAFPGTDCGEYLLRKGDCTAFGSKKAAVMKELKAAGIKQLIVHEPMTYKVLAQDYPLAKEGVKVVYYLEFLKGKFSSRTNEVKKVTFHDPSYLGRYMGEYDLPRQVLTELGYEITEMVRTRENAMTSGGFLDVWPNIANLASRIILEDADAAGAEMLVAGSHYSARQLKNTADKAGSKLIVKDIAELFS